MWNLRGLVQKQVSLKKATSGSACFDVSSARCVTLEPGGTKIIKTDIELKFLKKYVYRPYPH